MPARTPQRIDHLASILVTAVESDSISYWAEVTNYKYDMDTRHNFTAASVEIRDRSDYDSTDWKLLNINLIARGIGKIRRRELEINGQVRDWAISDDAGDIDSITADAIVQAGLFGKLIYG